MKTLYNVCALLTCTSLVYAEAPVPKPAAAPLPAAQGRTAVPSKVGFINMEELMANLQEYIDGAQDVQKAVEERAKAIEAKQKRGDQRAQELERKRSMMQEDAILNAQRELYELKTSIDFDRQALQAFVQNSQEMLNRTIQEKVFEAADRVRKKQGWDALQITPFPCSDRVNVTGDILDILNREYGERKKKAGQKELPTPAETDAPRAAPKAA